jgi:ubiquinone/menaquinone biosynthesis C-methylase UbiE
MGFVTKTDGAYGLTADSSFFLDKKSPAYVGGATRFLASPDVTAAYNNFADIVRSGGPRPTDDLGSGERSAWVDFARGMGPLARMVAELTEKAIHSSSEIKVLDLAASHGMYGIAVARHNPKARIVAADWPSVLAVAKENAESAGVADRLTLLPGDLLQVPFGTRFDLVLVPNLLHMWDPATIKTMLQKIHAALAPQGRIVIVEFVANDDRVSPPAAASFIMNMVANTTGGNVYTGSEYREMLAQAGFSGFQATPLHPTDHTAIVAVKR